MNNTKSTRDSFRTGKPRTSASEGGRINSARAKATGGGYSRGHIAHMGSKAAAAPPPSGGK